MRAEEERIEKCIRDKSVVTANWSGVGVVSQSSVRDAYVKRVLRFVLERGSQSEGMRVLIDAANGAASSYTPQMMRELGFSVVTINSHQDGYFPGRAPEPSPRNLGGTMRIIGDGEFSVGLCHDGDGDRLAVIDEAGQFVDQNRIIALLAQDEIEKHGRGTVVTSIDTSSVIDEVVEKSGGRVVRVPLGTLQEELRRDCEDRSIVFASEPWKPVFVELGMWMDGIAGAIRVAQLVETEGDGSCKRLLKRIPEYPILRDFVPCPDDLKACVMTRVRDKLLADIPGVSQVIENDGIRIDCDDGSYVLVRPSGTEPKVRMYIGARTEHALKRLKETTRWVVDNLLGECRHQRDS